MNETNLKLLRTLKSSLKKNLCQNQKYSSFRRQLLIIIRLLTMISEALMVEFVELESETLALYLW